MLKKLGMNETCDVIGGAGFSPYITMVGNFLGMVGTGAGAVFAGAIAVADPEPVTKAVAAAGTVTAAGGVILFANGMAVDASACVNRTQPQEIVYSNTSTAGRITNQASATYDLY